MWSGRIPAVLALVTGMLVACSGHLAETTRPADGKARLARAEAMFRERCKTAGEKIYRTVENVEGVFLMKIRPDTINYEEQFVLDDPYGSDSGGQSYLKTFFAGFYPVPKNKAFLPRVGYRYVEAFDPKDGNRYRYTGRIDEPWQYDNSYSRTYRRFVLDKVPAPGPMPRYGVTYDDISTREEREYWIAGSALRVIDLPNNEVIAERIGYMMDRGQGNTGGERSPWFFAADNACPAFAPRNGATAQPLQSENFVEKVLKPKLEN